MVKKEGNKFTPSYKKGFEMTQEKLNTYYKAKLEKVKSKWGGTERGADYISFAEGELEAASRGMEALIEYWACKNADV